ncbi:MAG: phage holin family protein [Patescibacteria group bacterium]
MNILMRLVVNAFALLVVAYIVPGFLIDSFWTAVVAAVVIGIVNTFIKPILQLIALPISLLTFGIASFLINVLLLWGSSKVVAGFLIVDFNSALLGSLVLSLVSWFLHRLSRD